MTARFLPDITVEAYHHAEGPPRIPMAITYAGRAIFNLLGALPPETTFAARCRAAVAAVFAPGACYLCHCREQRFAAALSGLLHFFAGDAAGTERVSVERLDIARLFIAVEATR